MPVERKNPYSQFNFVVKLSAADSSDDSDVDAGFQEVSGIGMEIAVSEYRNGNDQENHTRKIPGLSKSADVTCKRGLIKSSKLYDWLNDLRKGIQDSTTVRTVTIQLKDEAHKTVVTWKLNNAYMTKYTIGQLSAKGNDVAMEEMVLAYERLDMDLEK